MALLPKRERLREYFQRLSSREPAANHDEAMKLLCVLNDVENEFSGIKCDLDEAGTDGRMYPPNELYRYIPWERIGVRCYRQVGHATFVGDNGALEIRKRIGNELAEIVFEKHTARMERR